MAMPASARPDGLALERLGRRLREAPSGSPLRPAEDFRRELRRRLLVEGASSVAVAPRRLRRGRAGRLRVA